MRELNLMLMRVVHILMIVALLATTLLATNIRITEKSGNVRVAHDDDSNPNGLRWSDGAAEGLVELRIS